MTPRGRTRRRVTSLAPEHRRRLASPASPNLRGAACALALRTATIWVADGPARTLLRIRSELFVGAVTLDLIRVEPAA